MARKPVGTLRPSMGGRELWVREGLEETRRARLEGNYDAAEQGILRPAETAEEANLVSSRSANADGEHLPALDIDVPCRLVETSPGKHHLFIDMPMTWDAYRGVLHALVVAGVVEPGYVGACEKNGHTTLRLRPYEKERRTPKAAKGA